jgi:hypothetical protein
MTRRAVPALFTSSLTANRRPKHFSLTLNRAIAIFAGIALMVLAGSMLAAAQQEAILYSFHGGNDGASPAAGVITDGKGHLFGTTLEGGGSLACGRDDGEVIGCGTVFELGAPLVNGHATETILYAFPGGANGAGPYTPVVFDSAGNLYGTTASAGASKTGLVFELSPPQGSGPWTESVLYNFAGDSGPLSGVIVDSQGNLYGEAVGPRGSEGTIYELSPPALPGGAWTYTNLFSFPSGGKQGEGPSGGLVSDSRGDLYGTTQSGGTGEGPGCPGGGPCGVVFELVKPTSPGAWTEKTLYNFTGTNGDGGTPESGVTIHQGLLYGTTAYGGNDIGDGAVFSLSPPAPGKGWTETTLFQFDRYTGGFRPESGVVFDKAGNLYGSTNFALEGEGEIFQLSPSGQGDSWGENTVYNFGCGSGACAPVGNLLSYGDWIYGAAGGGQPGLGVIYKVSE